MKLGKVSRFERPRATQVLGQEETIGEQLDLRNMFGEEYIQIVKNFGANLFKEYNPEYFNSNLLNTYFVCAQVLGLVFPERVKEAQLDHIPDEEVEYYSDELTRLPTQAPSMSGAAVRLDPQINILHQFAVAYPERVKEIVTCNQQLLNNLDALFNQDDTVDARFLLVETLYALYLGFPDQREAIKSTLRGWAQAMKNDLLKTFTELSLGSFALASILLPELRREVNMEQLLPKVRQELKIQLSRFKKEKERYIRFHSDLSYLYRLVLAIKVFEATSVSIQADGTLKFEHKTNLPPPSVLPERSMF